MIFVHPSRALGACTVLCAPVSLPTIAQAQLVPPAPVRQSIDANGVDLLLGTMNVDAPAISMGGSEPQGLSYYRLNRGGGWHDNLIAMINTVDDTYTVTFGGKSDGFTKSGSTFTSVEANGATLNLSGSIYTYISSDGTTAHFDASKSDVSPYYASAGRVVDINRPNGQKLTFNYTSHSYCSGARLGECIYADAYRLNEVVSNYGYAFSFQYELNEGDINWNAIVPGSLRTRWGTVIGATLTNKTSAASVSVSESFATVTSDNDTYFQVSDPLSRITKYRMNGAKVVGITRPGSTAENVTLAYASDRVWQVTRRIDANTQATTTYTYSDTSGVRTTTVKDPLGQSTVYKFDIASQRMKSVTNAFGATTVMDHDASGRLTRVTEPEGNYTQSTYDDRGNIKETRIVAKGGLGLPDIVTTAEFAASCSNVVTCNSPMWTKDAINNQTDYSYDPTTGETLTVTLPAPAVNAPRPTTTYSYTAYQAYLKNSSGAIVASGQAVSLLTGVSSCRTTQSCAGTADETKTTVNYGPQSAGTGNNLLPVSISRGSGDGTLTATTSLVYDDIGNMVSLDGPLPGTADTTSYRYDAARRLLGVVSADPDGAGAMNRRATKLTYTATDQVMVSATGTVTDLSDAAWNNFAESHHQFSAYNDGGQVIRQTAWSNGVNYGIWDYLYDAAGRAMCGIAYMDPSRWGPQASSCTPPQTNGAKGPDRVTLTQYSAPGADNAVSISVTSGYGTAAASTETLLQTVNGKTASVTDANGNVTSYAYDGFDRAWRTCYQTASSAACAASPVDYEQLGYDAGRNVTSRRLRDGQTLYYTYDALNRRTYDDNPNTNATEVDVTYSYDLLGRVLRAQDGNGWFSAWEYDALGRATRQYSNIYGNRFQYDLAGRMTRQTWDDGFYVTNDYLVTGETSVIRENGGLALASFGYDDLGRRTSLTRGNGTTTVYAYDPASRLSGLTQDMAGTASDLTLGFAYNPAGQITSRTSSNDAYAWGGAANVSRGYTVNGLNQYTASGSVTPGYDARGNLTSAAGQSYVYNTRNQLFGTGVPGQRFYRNPAGGLVQILSGNTATEMDYISDRLATETTAYPHTPLRRYVYGPGTDEPLVWYEGSGTSDRRYLHADERGSVIAISNDAGAVTAINSYDEYGIPGSGNVGRFQYTGQKWIAELGMYDYKARMYSPTLGRFMQTDPIGYGDELNWYNYVGGDPVNKVDPGGLADIEIGVTARWKYQEIGFDLSWYFRDYSNFTRQADYQVGVEPNDEGNIIVTAKKQPQSEKKLPPCAQNFLKGRISGDPADITLHRGSPFELTGNSVTFGSDVYLAGNTFGRSDANALIHKFHEIQHTSQNARLGLSTFDHAAAYVVFGGHDASPYEQAADTFGDDAYKAYKAAGLDKTCPF